MAKPVSAFDFLDKAPQEVASVCALSGDDGYLKQLVIQQIRAAVLTGEDADMSFSRIDGATAELRDVLDELSTLSLFGAQRRLVLVEQGDDFVSRNRAALETYVAHPRSTGVLLLDVTSWPANARLAKAVASSGMCVECKASPPASLSKWLRGRAKKKHKVKLEAAAVEALVEHLGNEPGLLDQEVAKLALLVEPNQSISDSLVNQHVGGWQTQTAWKMFDDALDGKTATALAQLDRLLLAGENAIALLAQLSSNLRRLATATNLVIQSEAAGRRPNLRNALEQAGVKPFALEKAQRQMRRLGRGRAAQLLTWLMDADLALKGGSSAEPRARMVLEQLIIRISQPQQTTNSVVAS